MPAKPEEARLVALLAQDSTRESVYDGALVKNALGMRVFRQMGEILQKAGRALMIFYIHGFNSSAASFSGRLLERQLGVTVHVLEYRSDGMYSDNIASLQGQLNKGRDGFDVIVGTSMGGFYSIMLSVAVRTPCVAFNPVVEPRRQLRQFLGRNVNFSTRETYDFTEAMLDSYPDRVASPATNVPVHVYVSETDELLQGNAELVRRIFPGCTVTRTAHRIADFTPYLATIREFEDAKGCCSGSGVGD